MELTPDELLKARPVDDRGGDVVMSEGVLNLVARACPAPLAANGHIDLPGLPERPGPDWMWHCAPPDEGDGATACRANKPPGRYQWDERAHGVASILVSPSEHVGALYEVFPGQAVRLQRDPPGRS